MDVVAAAFNSDVGVENDPVQANGGYVWYEVVGITRSRDRTFDEVKDLVAARWKDDEIAKRLTAKADELVQKLNAGGNFADARRRARRHARLQRAVQARDIEHGRDQPGRDRSGLPRHEGRSRPGSGRRADRNLRVPRARRDRAEGRHGVGRREIAHRDAARRGKPTN